jgi:hypothetical protein
MVRPFLVAATPVRTPSRRRFPYIMLTLPHSQHVGRASSSLCAIPCAPLRSAALLLSPRPDPALVYARARFQTVYRRAGVSLPARALPRSMYDSFRASSRSLPIVLVVRGRVSGGRARYRLLACFISNVSSMLLHTNMLLHLLVAPRPLQVAYTGGEASRSLTRDFALQGGETSAVSGTNTKPTTRLHSGGDPEITQDSQDGWVLDCHPSTAETNADPHPATKARVPLTLLRRERCRARLQRLRARNTRCENAQSERLCRPEQSRFGPLSSFSCCRHCLFCLDSRT